MSLPNPTLIIAPSTISGRGVFTTRDLQKGELIELCPVIVVPQIELAALDTTILNEYYFLWNNGRGALALGYGSIYNHTETPNASYRMDYNFDTIDIFCKQVIKAGEEITIRYTKKAGDSVWFKQKAS